jgi:porin
MANPTGLAWSTPNSGVLAINEVGYRKDAAPGQLATWVRAASIVNTSRYVDLEFGGRNAGNYAAYVLADRQFVQLAPVAGQAARGWYAGVSAMYAPPEFNRFSKYYEFRLYGIGLLPSRPGDMISLVVSRNVFSHYVVDAALRNGQLAHAGNLSITAAYYAPVAPGVRVGIGLGYTDHPTPAIYTPQTGSALNLLANVVTYW